MTRSIVKERHERVPRREHQEQERKRNVHEEPAVQPVLHLGLQVEHAPFVAPSLDFLGACAVNLRYPKFNEPKCVFGEASVAEPIFFAASRGKVRNHLSIKELFKNCLRSRIKRRGCRHDWFRRDWFHDWCGRIGRSGNWEWRRSRCCGRFGLVGRSFHRRAFGSRRNGGTFRYSRCGSTNRFARFNWRRRTETSFSGSRCLWCGGVSGGRVRKRRSYFCLCCSCCRWLRLRTAVSDRGYNGRGGDCRSNNSFRTRG